MWNNDSRLYKSGILHLVYPVIILVIFFSGFYSFGILALVGLLGISVTGLYYSYAFKRNELLIYPIAASIFLGSSLSLFEGNVIPLTPFQVTLVIGLLVFFASRLFRAETYVRYNGLFIPVVLFLAIISFSLIYSPDKLNGFLQLIRFIVLILFCHFTSIVVKSKNVIRTTLALVVVVSITLSIYSVVENIMNPQAAVQNLLNAGTKLTRSTAGAFSDPNRFASILILPIATTFALLNSDKKIQIRIIAGLAFLLLIAGLLSTYSRSGFLAVFLLSFVIILWFNNVRFFLLFMIAGLLIGMSVPVIRLNIITYSERIFSLFVGGLDNSNSIRLMLGIGAINMFIDSYTFGVGFQGFNEVFPRYFNYQETITVQEPHNIIYTILAELGLLGFLIFSIIVYFIFKKALVNTRNAKSEDDRIYAVVFLASILGYFVFYQFYDGGLLDTSLMMIFGLIFAHHNILSERKN